MRLVTLFVCWQHLSCQALRIGMHPPGRSAARAFVVLSDAHWMDYLKFDSAPQFDVLERTKEYAAIGATENSLRDEYHAKDYVFRGSVIGPITGADVTATQKSFDVVAAYPDLEREMFGFTIDPQNPYKCFFFERWTGTNTASVSLNGNKLQPTGNRVDVPMHISSFVWNPEGKIVYQSISPPVDRFEGVCHLRPMCHPSPYPSPHADVPMLDCKRPPHIATSMPCTSTHTVTQATQGGLAQSSRCSRVRDWRRKSSGGGSLGTRSSRCSRSWAPSWALAAKRGRTTRTYRRGGRAARGERTPTICEGMCELVSPAQHDSRARRETRSLRPPKMARRT